MFSVIVTNILQRKKQTSFLPKVCPQSEAVVSSETAAFLSLAISHRKKTRTRFVRHRLDACHCCPPF